MRILFLRDYLVPSGGVTNMLCLLKGLRKANHKLQVITFGGKLIGEFEKNSIVVKQAKPFTVTFPGFRRFKQIIELARNFEPDIIQVESISMLKGAHKISGLLRIPCIFMVNQYFGIKEFLPPAQMSVIQIVTVSQALREYLVNKVRISKEQISLIQDGIDVTEYPVREAAGGRSQLSVGMSGRYGKERGHEVFLDAVRILADKGRNALFFISGFGEGEEKVKQYAKELGIYKNVLFVHEFTRPQEIISQYDIFVQPSKREGLGYSALEAMAMAKPVIASSVGGLMDVVRDGETGLLFQPGNAESLAAKIESLIEKPDEIRRMGKNGRKAVEEEFTLEKMVQNMTALYQQLVRSPGDQSTQKTLAR